MLKISCKDLCFFFQKEVGPFSNVKVVGEDSRKEGQSSMPKMAKKSCVACTSKRKGIFLFACFLKLHLCKLSTSYHFLLFGVTLWIFDDVIAT